MTPHRILALAIVLATVSARQAWAQVGDTPGTPGFEAPPAGPPPACQQLSVLRDERQKNIEAIGAARGKAAPAEACMLFKVFIVSENKFIQGMETNREQCSVPPEVLKQAYEGHIKAS